MFSLTSGRGIKVVAGNATTGPYTTFRRSVQWFGPGPKADLKIAASFYYRTALAREFLSDTISIGRAAINHLISANLRAWAAGELLHFIIEAF